MSHEEILLKEVRERKSNVHELFEEMISSVLNDDIASANKRYELLRREVNRIYGLAFLSGAEFAREQLTAK